MLRVVDPGMDLPLTGGGGITEVGVGRHAPSDVVLRARILYFHDVTQSIPILDAIPNIRGLHGCPLRRPRRLFADRGYDSDK